MGDLDVMEHWNTTFVVVNERGQFMTTGYDGRRLYTWYLDGERGLENADRLDSARAKWHENHGRTVITMTEAKASLTNDGLRHETVQSDRTGQALGG